MTCGAGVVDGLVIDEFLLICSGGLVIFEFLLFQLLLLMVLVNGLVMNSPLYFFLAPDLTLCTDQVVPGVMP